MFMWYFGVFELIFFLFGSGSLSEFAVLGVRFTFLSWVGFADVMKTRFASLV